MVSVQASATYEFWRVRNGPNFGGDPSRIRTCNPRSRNPLLYPVELWDRSQFKRLWPSLRFCAELVLGQACSKIPASQRVRYQNWHPFATEPSGGPGRRDCLRGVCGKSRARLGWQLARWSLGPPWSGFRRCSNRRRRARETAPSRPRSLGAVRSDETASGGKPRWRVLGRP